MLSYVTRRLLMTLSVLLVISIASFAIIQPAEGDFIDAYMLEQQMMGEEANLDEVGALRIRCGWDKPFLMQYTQWMKGVLTGDFGYSFFYRKPVSLLIRDRVGLSFAPSFSAMIFTWVVALAIGFYSATRQYSVGDHCFTPDGEMLASSDGVRPIV